MTIRFTGSPFVDAGLAGMCAAAGVTHLAQLDVTAINHAVDELLRLMTSEAAFTPRKVEGENKPKTFTGSDMPRIFTKNGKLSQSSRTENQRRQDYCRRVIEKRDSLIKLLSGEVIVATERCFVDGNPACFRLGNDEFPLLDSRNKRRNFHPGLIAGHPVGPLTALAIEFFPLSVLSTGRTGGFFWFVHTAAETIAVACAQLTRNAMNDAVAKDRDFGFFGDWDAIRTRSKEAALVALVRELTCGKRTVLSKSEIAKIDYPVAAYIFSNDSRSPTIEMHELPHPLFRFFIQLQGNSEALRRWDNEVLGSEKKGWLLARAMLKQQPLAGLSSIRPVDNKSGLLRGGWLAQAHYAKEVLGLSAIFIRDVEALATRITEHEDAKKLVLSIHSPQGPGEVRRAFLRLCQNGLLTDEEYALLLPPEDPFAAITTRDYLLAAIYEMQHAQERGQPFVGWDVSREDLADESPPQSALVLLATAVGESIAADERSRRFTAALAHATKTRELRQVMLRAAHRGLVSWSQWLDFFPPDKPFLCLLIRDYVLAYLYSHMTDDTEALPEPEPVDPKELKEDVVMVA